MYRTRENVNLISNAVIWQIWSSLVDVSKITAGTGVVGYDLNGNIHELLRAGKHNDGTYKMTDALIYSYNGNQIQSVQDAGGALVYDGSFDFKPSGSKRRTSSMPTRSKRDGAEMIRLSDNRSTHDFRNPIIKWETAKWGEIPDDFGRK